MKFTRLAGTVKSTKSAFRCYFKILSAPSLLHEHAEACVLLPVNGKCSEPVCFPRLLLTPWGQRAKVEPQAEAGLDLQGQAQTGFGPGIGPTQNCQEALTASTVP